ncbi:hypothetical protein HMPREF1550_00292 [Actinomyces sp. oral taxon 877 str. F0543]|nr:hypothetical protein HMPREF1550_00292 [Actinomyces sp. oral taxon 877 str. F0543]
MGGPNGAAHRRARPPRGGLRLSPRAWFQPPVAARHRHQPRPSSPAAVRRGRLRCWLG